MHFSLALNELFVFLGVPCGEFYQFCDENFNFSDFSKKSNF
jgi:hypothetical protein